MHLEALNAAFSTNIAPYFSATGPPRGIGGHAGLLPLDRDNSQKYCAQLDS
jgi:hypothetical protein